MASWIWQRQLIAMATALALGFSVALGIAAESKDDIKVHVDIQGEVVRVDAEVLIGATAREVWEVLTDFEHLPRFVSNITSTRVLARDDNVVRVSQQGKTSYGPLTFEFQSVRELTLTPYERFESRMLSGNMKSFHGTTNLETVEGMTQIRYHSEAVPDTAIPLSFGRSLIESETREHYREIRQEVLRRKF
jgi:uncharacterized membrane protein